MHSCHAVSTLTRSHIPRPHTNRRAPLSEAQCHQDLAQAFSVEPAKGCSSHEEEAITFFKIFLTTVSEQSVKDALSVRVIGIV